MAEELTFLLPYAREVSLRLERLDRLFIMSPAGALIDICSSAALPLPLKPSEFLCQRSGFDLVAHG